MPRLCAFNTYILLYSKCCTLMWHILKHCIPILCSKPFAYLDAGLGATISLVCECLFTIAWQTGCVCRLSSMVTTDNLKKNLFPLFLQKWSVRCCMRQLVVQGSASMCTCIYAIAPCAVCWLSKASDLAQPAKNWTRLCAVDNGWACLHWDIQYTQSMRLETSWQQCEHHTVPYKINLVATNFVINIDGNCSKMLS